MSNKQRERFKAGDGHGGLAHDRKLNFQISWLSSRTRPSGYCSVNGGSLECSTLIVSPNRVTSLFINM